MMGREIAAARGLAGFSLGLGLTELMAPERVSDASGVPVSPAVLRAFGLREIAAGALIAISPVAGLWSRVAGDALDIGTVAFRAREGNRRRIAVTLAMLAGVLLLDVWAARRSSRRRRGF
jgi:hypothetical protein